MKIVIDIPESWLQAITESSLTIFNGKIFDCIRKGTPLPKNHGRLIDADELKEIWHGCKFVGSIDCLVDCRPTIIEADKGESEEEE